MNDQKIDDGILVVAIDPGPVYSAIVGLWGDKPLRGGKLLNQDVMAEAWRIISDVKAEDNTVAVQVAIEMVASYGMPVGAEVFETVWLAGRMAQDLVHSEDLDIGEIRRVFRKQATLHLCNSARAKDSNVRRALLDIYPPTGGGKTPQVGTKSQPGPLFGFSKDMWAALAVAHFARDHWDDCAGSGVKL